MSTAQFKAGNTYRTRSGVEAGIDSVRETDGALMGWLNFEGEGRMTACWFPDGSMTNGRVKEDPYDLMPSQEDAIEQPLGALDYVTESGRVKRMVQSIEDVTPDRLSVVESSLRDVHRQLRVVRSNQVGLVASMAAKIEDLGKRLDGTDRRVAALKEGVNDAHTAVGGLDSIGRANAERINHIAQRVGAIESTLARIEDCLTSAAPMMPPRKSLGWLNVTPQEPTIRGTFVVLHPTRAAADMMASMRRVACVEIFEGDGL